MDDANRAADARQSILNGIASDPDGYVKVGVFDIDGILRGKYLANGKFAAAAEDGFGFCDVVLGWDMDDQLYDNVAFTGWHTGFPDASVRLDLDTGRRLPLEDGQPFFLGQFAPPADGICPRGVLGRVLERAARMGFAVKGGFEYEFFVFDETSESARRKDYLDLTPLSRGTFGYSVLRTAEFAAFYRAMLENCGAMRIPLEGLHEETGAGVLEAAIAATNGIDIADRAALFKTFAKAIAREHGKLATFMAKSCQEWPGQSGHIHISLLDDNGAPVFSGEGGSDRTMRHFVGGQQALMPQFLAMVAPTINSFTRLVPGFWAPTGATWGYDNRTCALRAITRGAGSRRVEYRVAAADANPYLALAAAVASGLYGIEHGIEPGTPSEGNAYDEALPPELTFPATLWEAAGKLHGSAVARDWFGDAFVDHFVATREWEEREFRRHVTDWERRRYFEIV